MKQKSLLQWWLLLLCLVVGAGTTWAEDKTVTLDYSSFGLTTSYGKKTATVDGFGFTVDQGYKGSGNTIQMNSSKGAGTLYNTTPITGLKSIKVNVGSGNKTYTITTGTLVNPTGNSQTGSDTGTYNANSGDTYFQLKVSGASYFSSIVITYDDAGGSQTLDDSDFALTNAPVALSFDLYNSSAAQTIEYTTSSTGAVKVSASEYVTTSVDTENKAITVTPVKVTNEAQTITVSQAADGTYKAGSATFTVTITNSNTPTSLTLTGDYPTTFTEGDEFSHEGMTVTATFKDNTTKVVTSDATFEGYNMSELGNQTVTVSYTENGGTATTTYTIVVNPIPTYAVNWSVNGTITSTDYYKEGDAIVFPADNPADIEGKTFVGWVAEAINGITDTAPAFVKSATMGQSALTFYAVFASQDSGSGSVTDVLTKELTGIGGTSYDTWENKTATSSAVYAGQSAGGNNSIQLRSSNNNSGIVTTASGGKLQKVTVEWNSNTGSGRTLDIYGKNSAYSKATDLYGNNAGTKLGSIVYGTSTELTISGDYTFIGLRSSNGAMYLDKISITWGGGVSYTGYCTTVGEDNRQEANLSFDNAEVTKVVTDSYQGEQLNNPNSLSPIIWTSTNTSVATVEAGVVTMVAVGETTIKAKFDGNNSFKSGEASYKLTVEDDPNKPGTENNPYTVAEAIAYINTLGTSTSPAEVYASGKVSQVDSYNDGTIIYWISDDGTTDNQMEVYKGKGLNGAAFTSKDDLSVGDDVTVCGKVMMYNNQIPEFCSNNYLVYYKSNQKPSADLAFTGTTSEYTVNFGDNFSAPELSNPYNVEVSFSSSDGNVATVDEQGALTIVGAGTTIITASFDGDDSYKPGSASYTLKVVDPNAPGMTENNPYTVAQARAAIDNNTGVTGVYAKGIVSSIVTAYKESNGYISYNISADGTETDQLQAYKGKSYNGDNFTSEDDIQVGDAVLIYGNLKKYNSTYEFDADNQLVNLVRKPVFSPEADTYTSVQSVTITTETEDAAIYYTTDGSEPTVESSLYAEPIVVNANKTIKAIAVKNGLSSAVATAEYEIDLTPSIIFDGNNVNPYNVSCDQGYTNVHYVASNITGNISLVLCDAEGNPATYDWFRAEITSEVYVKVEWDANEDTENARTAYFKLVAENAQSVPYAIIQAKFVADYATLPFAFDGGNGGISTTSGLTQNDLGSDYNSSPKLKFDSTGDWMILKINEAPGTLTFDIKGNSYSGSTFKVQTSVDGTTYTDLKTYTELGSNTQSEEFNNLGENVRYIKWIYTNKSSGNVALGNITLAKYVEPIIVPTITVDPATVNVNADANNGTLALTYENLTITEMSDFGIQYYNAAGDETSEPDWIEALVAQEQDGSYVVSYIINSNTGVERTAYFKVSAMKDQESFYSNLVTVTQAEYVEPFQEATYTLAKSIVPGKHYIIVGGETAMGAQNTNNRAAVEVEISDEKATVSSPNVREFVIAGPNVDGFYTIYDETEGGYLYAASSNANYLRTEATPDANALWSIGIDGGDGEAYVTAQGKNSRNEMKYNSGSDIFSCYGSGQQAIYLYGKDGDEGVQNVTVAVTAAGYATFVSDYALDYTEVDNVEAYTAKVEGDDITFTRTYTVPAGEGVLLKGVEGTVTTYEVPVVAPSFEGWKNDFIRGTGAAVPSYKDGKYNYILNKVDDIVGFFKANDQVVAKDRAYLQSTESASRMNISFADDATGISEMLIINDQKGAIYNLSGQRVAAPAKGLYITNGKKFVVK